ncbi:ETX/MTX2 family pore-forming toxin [Streptomyces zagrosensis]|uniref:Cytotoxin leucocidin n=1 Tax=Streptomyces zagrosensis TaxID=1042984 RepID=A0A7W9Q9A4_9ACTN|nr:ETX/MTX2 family pore-forming toxin [Streptomyces zagrosensis]MBB5934867.1 hypothetical protein [Streptomyces zagrosensis]
MASLQEITDAWGDWMANTQYPDSGGYWYTASTDYSSQSSLDAYHQHQVGVKFLGIQYDPASVPTPGSFNTGDVVYDNQTDVEQSVTYKQGASTEQSFTQTTSKTLKIGIELKAEVAAPEICKVSATYKMEVSLTDTNSRAKTDKQEWSVELPVKVPAHSQVEAYMTVDTATYDVNWTSNAGLDNCVAIWFNNKVDLNHGEDYHWLWFYPIGWVISDCVNNNLIDTSGYWADDGNAVAAATGSFTGGQGVSVKVVTKNLKRDNGGGNVLTHRFSAPAKRSRDGKMPIGASPTNPA